ncbi:MAG: response regulator [Enhydrobacter sp.]|nr:MAG: response regulator [Enhydrobacter sp.]
MGVGVRRKARILVVEDNGLLAEVIGDFVMECGFRVVGPATSLDSGLVLAREAALDAALLDINLGGRLSFPICGALAARRIPFAFLTGYTQLALVPAAFRSAPVVCKPFEPEEMKSVLEMLLAGRMEGPLVRASTGALRPARA